MERVTRRNPSPSGELHSWRCVSTRRSARFETRRDGYERWRSSEGGRDRYVCVHRLAAVVWGILDGLDDPRHVNHIVPIRRYTTEDNLKAVDPPEHGSHHPHGRAIP